MPISIGDALLKLGVDTRDLDKGMQGLGDRIKQHQKAIGLAMVAAGGTILAAGTLCVKTYAEMGDEVQKMALRTGFSTEALSELRHAAEISGADLSTLEKGIKRMSGTILDAQDGMETYIRAFEHIGIKVEELAGLNPEEQFLKIAEAIAEVEDPTKRAALAQDMFGRAGTELLPLFASGKRGLEELRKEAHDLGIVFDKEAANKAAELTDSMKRMQEATSGLKMKIANVLIPALMPLIEKMTSILKVMQEWTKQHPNLTKVIVIGTTALGFLLVALGSLLLLLPGLKIAVAAFGVVLHAALGPIGLITLAVMALIAAGILLWQNWDKVSNFFKNIFGRSVEAAGESVDRFAEDVRKNKDQMMDDLTALYVKWEAQARRNTELQKKELDQQAKDYREAHDERMELLDEEYAERLKLIDGDLAAQVKAYQKQIDALDENIKAQRKTEKERRDQERIDELKRRIAQEEDGDREVQLRKELQDFLRNLELERIEDELQAEKDALREQIDMARERADYRKDRAKEEYDFKKKYEEENFRVSMEYLEKHKEELDIALEREIARQQTELKKLKEMNLDKLEDVRKFVDEYNATMDQLKDRVVTITEVHRTVGAGGVSGGGGGGGGGGGVWMQKGGIAMRPMLARIAERVPEAVIPLDRLERMGLGGKTTADIRVYLGDREIVKIIGQPLVDEIRLRTGARF